MDPFCVIKLSGSKDEKFKTSQAEHSEGGSSAAGKRASTHTNQKHMQSAIESRCD